MIEWNEDNFDIDRYPFTRQAYDCRKYAFVSDVARLSVVYEYGGIYLDTDVELRAPLDDLMEDEVFFFFPNVVNINTGLGFGAQKHQVMVKKILDDYCERNFLLDNMAVITCPVLNTEVLKRELPLFQANGLTQTVEGIKFYSASVYDRFAIHHDQFSWMNEEQRKAMRYARKSRPNKKMREFLRNPKIFDWLDAHGLARLKKMYLFAVYDFIEYGPIYWFYRVGQKIKKRLKR